VTEVVATKRFTAEDLHAMVIRILIAWGMPDDAARATSDVIVDTDLSAIDSHGVSMLIMYEKLLAEGRLDIAARPKIVLDGPAYAVVDGQNGLGHPTGIASIRIAIDKARQVGIGVVAVRGSAHFGALGYYARLASDQGLIAIVTTTTRTPVMSATGGTTPILGTNPIAFTAPRVSGAPFVVDISTSVVALNKVKAYALKGHDLPVGWVNDRDGRTMTDACRSYSLLTSFGATINPLGGPTPETGGHKGFGLSLMVHVLSAALSNAALPGHDGEHDNLGHFFLAIDPELLNPGGKAADHVEGLIEALQRNEPHVLIPGEPEHAARAERSEHGIPLPDSLLEHLAAICTRAGIPMNLTPIPTTTI
jgi:LDH2 family malate/lactate/ureidoglycolate dehydrogenase